jgi:hypothetical protein
VVQLLHGRLDPERVAAAQHFPGVDFMS